MINISVIISIFTTAITMASVYPYLYRVPLWFDSTRLLAWYFRHYVDSVALTEI